LFSGNSFQRDVRKAGESVTNFDRIATEIRARLEVFDQKQAALAAAEHQLGEAAVDGKDLTGARKAIASRREDVAEETAVLNALRNRLLQVAGQMPALWDSLAAGLRQHEDALYAGFLAEWEAAVAKLTPLLARKATLEAAIGRRNLPAIPELTAPAAADLQEVSAPHALMPQLQRCVGRLKTDGQLAPLLDGRCPAPKGASELVDKLKSEQSQAEARDWQRRSAALK
jgi:hypothetical protein